MKSVIAHLNTEMKSKLKERYEIVCQLGEGSFGRVYKAHDKINHVDVAMKKLKSSDTSDGLMCSTLREMSLLKFLNHKNIMPCYDIVYLPDENQLYLILQLMNCDLKKLIKNKMTEHPCQYTSIMAQILSGVRYCHERRIIHRDLKPENILIEESTLTAKIADFGLAKIFSIPNRPMSLEIQTLWYKAPEALLGDTRYGCGVDIWSLGCIFIEMLTGEILFQGDSEIGQLFKIFNILGSPSSEDSNWKEGMDLPEYKKDYPKFKGKGQRSILTNVTDELQIDLLEKMLALNPKNRISADQCLHHPFFEQYDIIDLFE